MTGLVSIWSVFNSVLAATQRIAFDRKVNAVELEEPPIFIIGHWRSGTTLLHELLALDDRFCFPNNLDTFIPYHFLVSSGVLRPLLRLLLPPKRPMDNMSVHVDSPQEDDFAIMLMGAPTHYRRMGFPHNRNEYFRWLDFQNLDAGQQQQVESSLKYFFQALTYRHQKRLIVKSPPHTGRVAALARWFPGAKFVHISRHPYKVVPSTIRLWKIADDVHAFQQPKYSDRDLLNYVNRCQSTLYQAYFRDREGLDSNQLIEVSFESLVNDPSAVIESIYQQLELGDSNQVVDSVRDYFSQRKDHKLNRHDSSEIAEIIDQNWRPYMSNFGY